MRAFKLLKLCFLLIAISVFPTSKTIASDNIETAGDIIQILIPGIAYGTTFYLDDREGRTQFYKSFGTNLAATYVLKYAINSERPNGGDHSFPSGHTSAAFQGAAFIHKRYGISYGVTAYLGAAFVGYSRVEADKHYVGDVIAGAAIGIISSFYFTEPYKGVNITPTHSNGTYGIKVSKNF
ncbi:MAG: phosphatase PAP2 family protein [Sulfurovum sp.]|nr:phosphatase PAP2 family protein [Sulfurovum sp.]NNJ45722.1 phosphatase PAP2 family protein [Sulfurovum sp.]